MSRLLCFLGIALTCFGAQASLLALSQADAPGREALGRRNGFPAEAIFAAAVDREAALALTPGQTIAMDLPRALRYEVVFERSETLPSGSLTWVGYLQGQEKTQRVILTLSDGAAFGRVLTPGGEFIIETDAQGQWLYDLKRSGVRMPYADRTDALRAPPKLAAPEGFKFGREKAGPHSTVDLLLVYTPSMVSRLGSEALVRARLDHLVALSNQAYFDSGVALSLRIVRTELVAYSETATNDTALHEISGFDTSGPVPIPSSLTAVAGWRDTYGADLVILLRSFSVTYHGGSCGIAWLSVMRWSGVIYSNPDAGYGVVSDGWDGGYGCGDYTFAHEAGHLFGATHDRVTEGQPTGADPALVYDYAYGYGVAGSFHTIMAYGSSFGWPPLFPVFSSPNLTCNAQPCGKGVGEPDQAYNALALENTRELVAQYRGTTVLVQRAFVSARTGKDMNLALNCPATAPCRWFSSASAIVAPGGEIVAMHSGAYGAVTLNKSLSLVAAPGAYAGITVFAGAGVTIATPGVSVVLRGLTVNGLGGAQGVLMTAGAKLAVENCVIANFSAGQAVSVTGPIEVRILKSLLRDNSVGAYIANGASASISRSTIQGNTHGILVSSEIAGTGTKAAISDTVVALNQNGVTSRATASGATSRVALRKTAVIKNGITGLQTLGTSGGTAEMESVGANTVRQNATDVSGTLTSVPPT